MSGTRADFSQRLTAAVDVWHRAIQERVALPGTLTRLEDDLARKKAELVHLMKQDDRYGINDLLVDIASLQEQIIVHIAANQKVKEAQEALDHIKTQ